MSADAMIADIRRITAELRAYDERPPATWTEKREYMAKFRARHMAATKLCDDFPGAWSGFRDEYDAALRREKAAADGGGA